VRDTYLRTGILQPEDVVGGGHAMTPRYLEDQLGRSLGNLGLAAVDVYYVHNPETQLGSIPRKDFLVRIRAAFEMLERQVAAGRVGRYGVATWNGFRTRPDAREHLSLAELVREAETVAGRGHHFKVIQLPYNLAMHETYSSATQVVEGERLTPRARRSSRGSSRAACRRPWSTRSPGSRPGPSAPSSSCARRRGSPPRSSA